MSALIWPAETAAAELVDLLNTVPYVRAKVEVAWGQASGGLFTFGSSLMGGPDVLAASSWSTTFAGANADLSARVLDADWNRGRDSDLGDMRAGTATVHLRDGDGLLNRLNPASPLYAQLQDPSDYPIRITLYDALGVAYPRFYGFIDTVEADLVGRGTATITATDFLAKIAAQNPVVAPAAGLTDGQILGKILDYMHWTDPALRALDVGDTIGPSYTRADGTRDGLALTAELLAAERGIVFAAGSGALTYRSRNSRLTRPSAGTIDRTLRGFPVGSDGAQIRNVWTVQRLDMAGAPVGAPQTAQHAASVTRHGPIPDRLETPFVASDSNALNLAQALIQRTALGTQPVYDIPLAIPDAATLALALARDLGDRVTLTVDPLAFGLFTSDFVIESINERVSSVSRPRYSASWRVSTAPPVPFRFGISLMGGPDPLGY